MKTERRTLIDGSVLTVSETEDGYCAKIDSDTRNLGFEGDTGPIMPDETLASIADEISNWMNDNLTN